MEKRSIPDQILVTVGKGKADILPISGQIFVDLFENSHVYSMAPYLRSLANGRITLLELKDLARKAEIPYTLFFGPHNLAKAQIDRKSRALLAGASKGVFSLNSRGTVEVRDVELIIKDILRKQMLPKKTLKESENEIVGMLKNSKLDVVQQAEKVRSALALDLEHIKLANKDKTFDYLVRLLGDKNIFVAQSSRAHMPQTIQSHVKFSGMCVKDKTYPFIFLNNKDEEMSFEPRGRKIFTLTLLLVCITKAKFSTVTYSEKAKDLIKATEFRIAEEILMPEAEFTNVSINNSEELVRLAEKYSVTPSAILMRLRRLGRISPEEADVFFTMLNDEFNKRKPSRGHQPAETTAFLKYNSPAYTSKVFELLDRGAIGKREVRRILLQNRQKVSFLDELRNKL